MCAVAVAIHTMTCVPLQASARPARSICLSYVGSYITIPPHMMTCLFTSLGPRIGNYMTFTFLILAAWN